MPLLRFLSEIFTFSLLIGALFMWSLLGPALGL